VSAARLREPSRTSGPGRDAGRWAALAALIALSGCAARDLPGPEVAAAPAPGIVAAPPPPRAAEAPTDELTAFYAEVEAGLVTAGKMRRDTAPADAPFGEAELVRNFERVALYDEYVDLGGRFLRRETPALLRRWERPVRVGVVTSDAVPAQAAARDRANVEAFTARLARLTGLDMAMANGGGANGGGANGGEMNFLVMFLTRDEQAAFADDTAARFVRFDPAVIEAFRQTPVDTFCTAFAFSAPDDPSVYAAVMILIKAEHPELTRLSCVQEEMAQAMGLPNDSPEARPSLFNDSLEFALLTEHDEILLRMLYDPRLQPGMSAAEARPLLPAIARDAMAAHLRQLTN
jgi:hypothetical protein